MTNAALIIAALSVVFVMGYVVGASFARHSRCPRCGACLDNDAR